MGLTQSRTNVKLLFLDVDGVLNTRDSCREGIDLIDAKIKYLKQIVLSTNAKIVISSSWRLKEDCLNKLGKALEKHGLAYIGVTPRLYFRTDEIQKFMDDYCESHDMNLEAINEKIMQGHFVQTSVKYGLTEGHVEMVISLLNLRESKI